MAIINNTEARFHSVPTKNGGASIKLAPGFNPARHLRIDVSYRV